MRRLVLVAGVVLAASSALSSPGASAAPGESCDHRQQKVADDPETGPVCSHGDDPATDSAGAQVFPADSGVVPAPPCYDDGRAANRIEVLYGHPADRPDNYAASVDRIRATVAFADHYFEQSDAGTTQRLRWLCDAEGQVVIHKVALTPVGDDGTFTFGDMYRSVALGGGKGKNKSSYRSRDRIYVTFVDGVNDAYPFCGQGNFDADDSPRPSNKNNTGPAYSLVACWNGTTTLHEIGHNLGAVQYSAPHTSGAAHCYDEFDVMCYDDNGSYFRGPDGVRGTSDDRQVQVVCADAATLLLNAGSQTQFDCSQDDYYNPNPAPGSYLATHWNIASSDWVQK